MLYFIIRCNNVPTQTENHDFMVHEYLICIPSGFSEDALNPLSNQLTFTFEGLPSATLQNIRPVLLPGIKTTTDHNVREGIPISISIAMSHVSFICNVKGIAHHYLLYVTCMTFFLSVSR